MAVNSYDEVPYESQAFSQTHPSRLFTVGSLFGMTPPSIERCRVLELGCAAGWNLLPMAERLPGAEFVGVDLSARQIAQARDMADLCGVKNVQFEHASILDVDLTWGTFDYIITHGVYSWVPDDVQRAIFTICARQLTPHGIAFISYNTFPGWHMRAMVREMMRYHSARFETPQERIDESRELLDFLTREVPQGDAYQALLRRELDTLRQASDSYLYHEHLEEVNVPVYFHEFAERAQRHGLRYLGESHVPSMVASGFGTEARETLHRLATDEIQAEQYMDFLRNRMFRETLLVHANQRLTREIPASSVYALHIATKASLVDPPDDLDDALRDERELTFAGTGTLEITTRSPQLKVALWLLHAVYPNTRSFRALCHDVRVRLGRDSDETIATDEARLAVGLLTCFLQSSLVQLHGQPVSCAVRTDGYPAVSRVSRETARLSRLVTNHRHEAVRLDDLSQQVVCALDGTRDVATLLTEFTARALSGDLPVKRDDVLLTEEQEIRTMLAPVLEAQVERLRALAVLNG